MIIFWEERKAKIVQVEVSNAGVMKTFLVKKGYQTTSVKKVSIIQIKEDFQF